MAFKISMPDKLIGLGGFTESISGRNPAQQQLGIALEKFNSAAAIKGIDGLDAYEALQKEINKLMEEFTKLQGELGTLEENRDLIIRLETKMTEKFADFILSVARTGQGGLAIVKLVDPNFSDNPSKDEIAAKLNDPDFKTGIMSFAKNMTDQIFTQIEAAVTASGSTDFAKHFGTFSTVRKAFNDKKNDLVQINADITTKRAALTAKEGEKGVKEGAYNELKPLYDEVKNKEKMGNNRTARSRTLNMVVGAAVATVFSYMGVGGTKTPAPQTSLAAPFGAVSTIAGSPSFLPGHSITRSGDTISITPKNQTT